MAQERLQTVGQALEQARSARENLAAQAGSADQRRELVLAQIADARIGIEWSLIGITTTLMSKLR